jgi:hypothetical protein
VVALALSLVVTLVGLGISSRIHHQWGPFLLGGMSALTVVVALSRLDPIAAVVATAALAAASVWNFLLNRRTTTALRRR